MTTDELVMILKKMYNDADNGFQVANIHLFGMKYANELQNKNLKLIATKALNKESYYAEINKGIKLSFLLKKEVKEKKSKPFKNFLYKGE